MARGDHLRVRRQGYWHHGIDCGDGTVVHFSGEPKRLEHAMVCRATMEEFRRDGEIETVVYSEPFDPEAVVRRAESRLGEQGYDPFHNNCEHFAHWCITGVGRSYQVRRILLGAATVVAATGALVLYAASPLFRRALRKMIARR